MVLHLLVHLSASLLKQRLVEVAIAYFPGQVGDGGEEPVGQSGHPVEKRPKRFFRRRRELDDSPQTSFENGQNGRDLLLQALVRFVNPEQTLFQGRRALQRLHAVVSERTLERADESRWESVTARFQHAQVRKKIDLGAWLFTTGLVYFWIALEKGADVDKDVEDLIFALSYFVALHGTTLAPLGEQSHGSFGLDVKTQHELTQLVQALTADGLNGFIVV